MGLPTSYSLVSSLALSLLTFAAMQVFKDELAQEGKMAVLGGFIGSWFFVFILTAMGNLETLVFGDGHYTKLFPEVIVCLLSAVVVSGLVHRVSATTCLLFSFGALYYINRISQSVYSHAPPTPGKPVSQKGGGAKSGRGGKSR